MICPSCFEQLKKYTSTSLSLYYQYCDSAICKQNSFSIQFWDKNNLNILKNGNVIYSKQFGKTDLNYNLDSKILINLYKILNNKAFL